MKQVILIKQCSAIQLAHLYEHLFCSRVDGLFYEHGLFSYLDYTLSGRTHQSGIIYISFEIYTDRAANMMNDIDEVRISLTNDSIAVAASQLIAEHEHAYLGSDIEEIRKCLADIDNTRWQNLDSIVRLDTTGVRRQSKPYCIDTERPLPAKKLSVGIFIEDSFKHEFRYLIPLFRLMCFFISETYETRLSDIFGFYPTGGVFKNSRSATNYKSSFNIPHSDDTTNVHILEAVEDTIEYIYMHKGFERFAEELTKISYEHSPRTAPDALHGLTDTGILVGPQGWSEISTEDNIELILDNLRVGVTIGNSKVDKKLALPART